MSAPDVAAAAAVAPLAPQGRRHAAKLAPLFRPLPQGEIGHLPAGLRNRVIFPPCTRWVTPGGLPASAPDSMAEYYANRAAHCGLVVTEGLYMDVPGSSPHPDATVVVQGECMEQWREVCDAVHAVGGLIAPQIHHVGIQRRSEPEDPSISPSGISMKGKPVRGLEPMTLEQIGAVQDEYIATAQRCADVGFDGIAIHSAHGYLLHQFLWSTTNHRTDQYGGEAANRRRFLHEIVSRIRAEVRRPDGTPIMIMLRFSQFPPRFDDERGPPHAGRVHKTSAALGEFVTAMAAAGVDLFDCSTEEFWHAAFPSSYVPTAPVPRMGSATNPHEGQLELVVTGSGEVSVEVDWQRGGVTAVAVKVTAAAL
eukprot:COSAG04_NODE_817_length_10082_cov_2.657418_7_plen_366_part_00